MKLKKLLFIILTLPLFGSVFAQLNSNCPGCVINTAQFGTTVTDYSVGLFPDTIVVRQNSPTSIDVTYLLPKQAATGISVAPNATVTQVQILGINGSYPIPSGLSVTCNVANCTYQPQTYRYGCVKICGTTPDPATNGFVLAKITVAGTGTAAGQTQTQNQDISFYFKILPDTTACHTVCFQNKINSGCDSATLGVYPGIDIACADPILHPCSFDWAYGNGDSSSGLTAHTTTYVGPGAYPVTLTKKTGALVITDAALTSVSGFSNICNGYNFLNPGANHYQLNFTIGSNSFSTSAGGNAAQTYSGLNDTVTNQAVAVVIQDNCLLTTLTSTTATLTVTGPGTYNFTMTGSNAGSGTITVAEVPYSTLSYTDSAYIYASPAAPIITSTKDSLCSGDSTRLSIGSRYGGYTILWYQDSSVLIGKTDTFIYAQNAGNYLVKVADPVSHCNATSLPHAIAVSQYVLQATTIYYQSGPHQLFLNPFLPGYYANWYFDSTLVTGQNGQFLPNLGNGNYYAVIYPIGYAQCNLASPVYSLNINGINESSDDISNLTAYPNPNNGIFAIKVDVITPGNVNIRLTDMLGRIVYENTLMNQSGEIRDNINVSALAKNVYTLEVSTEKGRAAKRIIVD
jgi:hypothetical protein